MDLLFLHKLEKRKRVLENHKMQIQAYGRTGVRGNARTSERENGRTGVREIKRHAFNFYSDQIEQLQWLEAKKKVSGVKDFSMSALLRDHVDSLLKKLKNKGDFDGYPNG